MHQQANGDTKRLRTTISHLSLFFFYFYYCFYFFAVATGLTDRGATISLETLCHYNITLIEERRLILQDGKRGGEHVRIYSVNGAGAQVHALMEA